MDKEKELNAIRMYCPNCGVKVLGIMREDGAVLIKCKRCQVVIFSKKRSPREMKIKVTNPIR